MLHGGLLARGDLDDLAITAGLIAQADEGTALPKPLPRRHLAGVQIVDVGPAVNRNALGLLPLRIRGRPAGSSAPSLSYCFHLDHLPRPAPRQFAPALSQKQWLNHPLQYRSALHHATCSWISAP